MSGYSEPAVENAARWYKGHWQHVNALMATTDKSYPASGSDVYRPELWKPGHWRYFFSIGNVEKPK